MKYQQHDPTVQFFCQHLVGLAGYYQVRDDGGDATGPPQFFCYSGTVLSVADVWFFVTAGHALKQLDKRLDDPRVHIAESFLLDTFTENADQNPIPYPLEDFQSYYVDDREAGLDYGIVLISNHDRRLLEANKITPIAEARWLHQDQVDFDGYMMLGFPEETQEVLCATGGKAATQVTTDLFAVEEIPHPEGVPMPANPWFVARIHVGDIVDDIVGMSGCPIFGFARIGGKLRYWPVAIQSWWNKDERIAYGCRLRSFAPSIAEEVYRQLYEVDSETDST